MVKHKVTIEIEDDDDGGISITRTVSPIPAEGEEETPAILAGIYIIQNICERVQDDCDIVSRERKG